MPPLLRLLALLPMLLPLAPASALTRLATIGLPAPLVAGRVSEDGATMVVLLQAAEGHAARLQLYDTRDPRHPQARGALDVPPAADIALSGDGRRALLQRPLAREAFNRETGHELLALDLADAAAPRVLWRETVAARQVALSSQADAFAYSRRTGRADEGWETVVVAVADRSQRVIAEFLGLGGRAVLSPHGRHLAQSDGQQLRIQDLRAAEPVHAHEPVFVSRFAPDCTFAALDTGHVLVSDARVPRLGVYAAAPEVPRVARLDANDPGCRLLNPNAADRAFALADAFGGVTVIDLRDPQAPLRGPSWQLPSGQAFGAAQGVLFAATDRPAAVMLWRADAVGPEVADGRRLAAAHRDARAVLAAKGGAGGTASFAASFEAAAVLEAAGVVPALAAPLAGIADRQAAAVFDDYGLLAARIGRPARIVEAARRRAIALDPRRATAAAAQAARASDPAAGVADDCDAIAAWTNAGRLQELLSDVGTDLPVDGRRIDLVFGTEGTAHVPVFHAFDAADHALAGGRLDALDEMTQDGAGQLALLTLKGRHHVLHFRDAHHPIATAPLGPGRACAFAVTTRVSTGPGASEPELCAALRAGRPVARLAFDAPPAMEPGEVRGTWAETDVLGTRVLDLGNDGTPRSVAELRLSSGAGAGCEAIFYDLLDDDGTAFATGSARDRLFELQGARTDARYPVRCGNAAGFLSWRGRTYFDSRPAQGAPPSDATRFHRVSTVRGGRVVEVCDFRFSGSVAATRR